MNYIALGGGTNSLAMLIGLHQRGEPIDVVIFADTKAERPETYRSIDQTNKWLTDHGYKPIVIVTAVNTTLEDDCIKRKAIPSVAYGFKTCSQRFKLKPQEKFANNYEPFKEIWANGGKVTKLIGYDAGEERRADNAEKYNREDKKFNYRYPLIEWGYDRDDCVRIIEEEGLKQPGKSSCFFCPNMRKNEVLELRVKHPDLMKRALFMEGQAELKTIHGLGRNYSWKELIEMDEAQIRFDDYESDMPCGCYDG